MSDILSTRVRNITPTPQILPGLPYQKQQKPGSTVEAFKENESLNFPDIIREESQTLKEIVILDVIFQV